MRRGPRYYDDPDELDDDPSSIHREVLSLKATGVDPLEVRVRALELRRIRDREKADKLRRTVIGWVVTLVTGVAVALAGSFLRGR